MVRSTVPEGFTGETVGTQPEFGRGGQCVSQFIAGQISCVLTPHPGPTAVEISAGGPIADETAALNLTHTLTRNRNHFRSLRSLDSKSMSKRSKSKSKNLLRALISMAVHPGPLPVN